MGENNNKRPIAFIRLFNLDLGGNVKSVYVTNFFFVTVTLSGLKMSFFYIISYFIYFVKYIKINFREKI